MKISLVFLDATRYRLVNIAIAFRDHNFIHCIWNYRPNLLTTISRYTSGGKSFPKNPDSYNTDLGLDDEKIFLVLFSTIFILFIFSVMLVYLVFKFFESLWKETKTRIRSPLYFMFYICYNFE